MESPIGELCKHCTGSGCGIWDSVPDKCKTYDCAYSQHECAPVELRPDKCGVIFEKLADDLMFGLMFTESIPQVVLKQIDAFIDEGYSVVIDVMEDKKLFAFPADSKSQRDVMVQFRLHQDKLRGRSNLRN